jgi:hypothetical protein
MRSRRRSQVGAGVSTRANTNADACCNNDTGTSAYAGTHASTNARTDAG